MPKGGGGGAHVRHCRRAEMVEYCSEDGGVWWADSPTSCCGCGGGEGDDNAEPNEEGSALLSLMVADFLLSFVSVWKGPLFKRMTGDHWLLMEMLDIGGSYLTRWVGKTTKGTDNPIMAFLRPFPDDSLGLMVTIVNRIPIQVIGHITGVKTIGRVASRSHRGPKLKANLGATSEGFTVFVYVMISLFLREAKLPFFPNFYIGRVVGLFLEKTTGGFTNPASACGWAYARRTHLTKEHLVVYWFAPFAATLLARQLFRFFSSSEQRERGYDGGKVEIEQRWAWKNLHYSENYPCHKKRHVF